MNEQINIFDFDKQPFKINNHVRTIEVFAGYGSQYLSMKYLNADVESYKICEWAVKSIQAYKDLHFGDDNTDYSAELSRDEVIDYLFEKGISADYNKPMTREQIKRMGEAKCRTVYNNIKATHNLVSVTTAKGDDFEITDRDKFTYLLTYSFPCQDLSLAGQRKGMSKESGTRSGLLWEVERILKELGKDRLPQVLLMENVPSVICDDFFKWCEFLNSLGYNSKYKIMNAKNYGMPQNRERCFMVSILGDYFYTFPEEQKLELRLKDMLETDVDEKYYLSDKMIDCMMGVNAKPSKYPRKERFLSNINRKNQHIANTIKTTAGSRPEDNFIKCLNPVILTDRGAKFKKNTDIACTLLARDYKGLKNYDNNAVIESVAYDEQNRYIRQDGCIGTLTTDGSSPKHNNRIIEPDVKVIGNYSPSGHEASRIVHRDGIAPTIKENHGTVNAVNTNYRIRKLTPKECFRLMGVKDDDYEKIAQNQSNSSLYHLAGDSIVTNCLMEIFKMMLEATK